MGVARSIWSAYRRSISVRISRGVLPCCFRLITTRVTPRHISQVGAMLSNTTLPSELTAFT